MRQVGILAAAGLIALEEMPDRLEEDHRHARILAETMAGLPGFKVDLESIQTNIVIADLVQSQSSQVVSTLQEERVLAVPTGTTQIRLVTHRNVCKDDIERVVRVLRRLY